MTVLFHGIKVHTEKDDLCAKSSCPINGAFTLNNAEALPSYTPPVSDCALRLSRRDVVLCNSSAFVLEKCDRCSVPTTFEFLSLHGRSFHLKTSFGCLCLHFSICQHLKIFGIFIQFKKIHFPSF